MQVSFRTIQLTDGKKRVNGALRARAAVRPALRQGSAFLLGLAGGWAVLYGALMPFGLGLTLGFAEDCFAVGAAGAALGVLARSFGPLAGASVCLLCALGAAGPAVAARRWRRGAAHWGEAQSASRRGRKSACRPSCSAAATPCWQRRRGTACGASRPKNRAWAV